MILALLLLIAPSLGLQFNCSCYGDQADRISFMWKNVDFNGLASVEFLVYYNSDFGSLINSATTVLASTSVGNSAGHLIVPIETSSVGRLTGWYCGAALTAFSAPKSTQAYPMAACIPNVVVMDTGNFGTSGGNPRPRESSPNFAWVGGVSFVFLAFFAFFVILAIKRARRSQQDIEAYGTEIEMAETEFEHQAPVQVQYVPVQNQDPLATLAPVYTATYVPPQQL